MAADAALTPPCPERCPRQRARPGQAESEAHLSKLADSLREQQIDHVCWREQPENTLTALATKPYTKSATGDAFRRLKLFK